MDWLTCLSATSKVNWRPKISLFPRTLELTEIYPLLLTLYYTTPAMKYLHTYLFFKLFFMKIIMGVVKGKKILKIIITLIARSHTFSVCFFFSLMYDVPCTITLRYTFWYRRKKTSHFIFFCSSLRVIFMFSFIIIFNLRSMRVWSTHKVWRM